MLPEPKDFATGANNSKVESVSKRAYLLVELLKDRKKIGFIYEHDQFTFVARVSNPYSKVDEVALRSVSSASQEADVKLAHEYSSLIEFVSPGKIGEEVRRPLLAVKEVYSERLSADNLMTLSEIKEETVRGDRWMLDLVLLLDELYETHNQSSSDLLELHVATFYGEIIRLSSLTELFNFLGLVGSR